jgi:hypothetical protein
MRNLTDYRNHCVRAADVEITKYQSINDCTRDVAIIQMLSLDLDSLDVSVRKGLEFIRDNR